MRRRPAAAALFVVLLLTLGLVTDAYAHKPSDSYVALTLEGSHVGVRWDIALRDLDHAIGLDTDASGTITWGEVRARKDEVERYAMPLLVLRTDGGAVCTAGAPAFPRVISHSDGTYLVLRYGVDCPSAPRTLDVEYDLFFELDPLHRGIVRISDGASTRTAILSSSERHATFDRANAAVLIQMGNAVTFGLTHIFEGVDHLLFLIALLLPSVLVRSGNRTWTPVARLKPALLDVLRIVTSFTLAHSITLSLSALDVLRLPSRLVESGIALSVAFAAVNNLWPVLRDDRWVAAFALGLLHGFGFSATLMDADLPHQNLVLTLFGFNLGVEIGQMCVVVAFVPLAFLFRRTKAYRWGALAFGSVVIAAVASAWSVERAFVVRLF